MELGTMTALELAKKIRQRQVKVSDGVNEVLGQIEKKEGKVYRRKEISEYSSRSFYVGDDVSKEDIKAKYENGVLSLVIPKVSPKLPERSYIAIE